MSCGQIKDSKTTFENITNKRAYRHGKTWFSFLNEIDLLRWTDFSGVQMLNKYLMQAEMISSSFVISCRASSSTPPPTPSDLFAKCTCQIFTNEILRVQIY